MKCDESIGNCILKSIKKEPVYIIGNIESGGYLILLHGRKLIQKKSEPNGFVGQKIIPTNGKKWLIEIINYIRKDCLLGGRLIQKSYGNRWRVAIINGED